MVRTALLLAALLGAVALTHGRELSGVKIIKDETSPLFASSTSGGILIAGKGVDIARATTITAVTNKDKKTGVTDKTFVRADGTAIAAGKLPNARVRITSAIEDDGQLRTSVRANGTSPLGKPKVSAAAASVRQLEITNGFLVNKKNLTESFKVVAESQASASAIQAEKKAPSGVAVTASTQANVTPDKKGDGLAFAAQGTTVSPFDTSIKNIIPNGFSKQNSTGSVTAVDKAGNVVFEQEAFAP